MFIYSIPYFKEETKKALVHTIYSTHELKLIPLLKQFFSEIHHGYLDEDYNAYSDEKCLKIAYETYGIINVSIQEIRDEIFSGMYYVEDAYHYFMHFSFCINALKNQSEILLTSHILYEREVDSDDVHFLVDGVEIFLFDFYTPEENEVDDIDLPKEEFYSYKTFDDGIVHLNTIEIQKPLQKEEELIDVFFQFSKQIELDVSGKTVRLATSDEIKKQPLFDKLLKQIDEDDDFLFSIPMHLAFPLSGEIPPQDQLIELLKVESEETIACVLDGFSDEYILGVLEKLPEKRESIIQRFIQIPSATFKERFRFIHLFKDEYDLDFVKERIEYLKTLDCVKNPDKEDPHSKYIEFLAWEKLLEMKQ